MTTRMGWFTGHPMNMMPTEPVSVRVGPFDYWPASASRILGLGGTVVDPDPAYAFHTQYVELGSGIVRCAIRFEDMDASVGILSIQINGIPPLAGARAESVRTWSAPLRHIADGEGVVEVSFQASAGTRYAVLGYIYGEGDARATGLSIVHETTPDSADAIEALGANRKSIFGRRVFRQAKRIVDTDSADLADPVSQPCTPVQFREAAYAAWLGEMRVAPDDTSAQWGSVFILQALSRYGMLRPGARGLGLGGADPRLPAVMAAHGCSILATDLMADPRGIERLRFPEICADDVFDRQVSYRAADLTALDQTLTGFDFLWSRGALDRVASVADCATFFRASVSCLTFGGLAVHVTAYDPRGLDPLDTDPPAMFRKPDLERIAVDLISRGHYVAQFKYDPAALVEQRADDPAPTAAFGIIVRRGDR